MRKMTAVNIGACVILLWLAAPPGSAADDTARVGFTKAPSARKQRDSIRITFAVNRATDVAVYVLNAKGEVVRHLAAGVLGKQAPRPFKPGSLAQTLEWDGKDDRGRAVPEGAYTVKVGLGTEAKFHRFIGFTRQWLGNIYAMACDGKGRVYAYSSRGLVVLDRQGKVLRQIAPAPAGFPVSKLAGLKPVTLKDGSVYFRRGYAFPGGNVASMGITPDGHLLLPGPPRYARNLTKIGTDGSVPDNAFDTRLTRFSDIGYLYVAASPDGKYAYVSGAEAGYKGDDARIASYRHSVYRLKLGTKGPAENFIGDDENGGIPGYSAQQPKGLACDAKGNLYVCRYRANDIVVYDPSGKLIPPPDAEDGVPISHPNRGADPHQARGFAVAPNGDMYAMYYDDKYPGKKGLEPWDRSYPLRIAVAHVSASGKMLNPRLIAHLRAGAGGLRVDARGNIFVGDNVLPLAVAYPSDFVGVLPDPLKQPYLGRVPGGGLDPLLRNMGSLFKFGPKGGTMVGLPALGKGVRGRRPPGDLHKPSPQLQWFLFRNSRVRVAGALWQFHGLAPVPAQYHGVTHVEQCVCLSGRFDLDEFGRAFVPDALRRRVTVLDSAGNVVLRFGRPGNLDSDGSDLAFAAPWWVAACSDRVFVSDRALWRISRVRLTHRTRAECKVEFRRR